MSVVVLPCKCENAYQDKRYGNHMRVHNTTTKEGKARCTVCKALNDYKVSKVVETVK
jgi:hypothetical protein